MRLTGARGWQRPSRQLALDADELAGVEVGGLQHVVDGLGVYAE
jgi:hypothetical protein